MDKKMTPRGTKQPMTVRHGLAMVGVGVVAVLVAFVILHAIAGIVIFFVKLAIVIGVIAAAFYLVSRSRR